MARKKSRNKKSQVARRRVRGAGGRWPSNDWAVPVVNLSNIQRTADRGGSSAMAELNKLHTRQGGLRDEVFRLERAESNLAFQKTQKAREETAAAERERQREAHRAEEARRAEEREKMRLEHEKAQRAHAEERAKAARERAKEQQKEVERRAEDDLKFRKKQVEEDLKFVEKQIPQAQDWMRKESALRYGAPYTPEPKPEPLPGIGSAPALFRGTVRTW